MQETVSKIQSKMAPQYQVNANGTISANQDHFDNHFAAIAINSGSQRDVRAKSTTHAVGDYTVDHT